MVPEIAGRWESSSWWRAATSWRVVAGVTAVVLVVVGGCLALRSEERAAAVVLPRASPVPPSATVGAPEQRAAEILVHAAGAVARPGVYRLAPSARIIDLLAAAGGPAAGVDLRGINLAAPLTDGARVHFPSSGEDPPAEVEIVEIPPAPVGTAPGGDPPGALVDLNSASAAELETLPGIGPVTAAAIVTHREREGPFRSVAALQDVTGIGPAKLGGIADLVTVTQ